MKFVENRDWSWSDVMELRREREYRISGGRITEAAKRKGLETITDDDNWIIDFRENDVLKDDESLEDDKYCRNNLYTYLSKSPYLENVKIGEFYHDLFSRKELQAKGDLSSNGKYNLIALEMGKVRAKNDNEYRYAKNGKIVKETLHPELYDGWFIDNDKKIKSITYNGELIFVYQKGDVIRVLDKHDKRKTQPLRKTKRYIISEGLDDLKNLVENSQDFCFMSPISYCGKSRGKENARFLYAMAIEIDNLLIGKWEGHWEQSGMANLFYQIKNQRLPQPTYIVWSGNGVHLYFVFDEPIALFKQNIRHLSKWRRELTYRIWNSYITESYKKKDIQFESLFQGFRIVGTLTKRGLGESETYDERFPKLDMKYERCRVWKYKDGAPVSLEYLVSFCRRERLSEWAKEWEEEKAKDEKYIQKMKGAKKSIAEMKAEWGEDWYNRHFDKKGKPKAVQIKKTFETSRAFYDNFKNKIADQTEEGHRYYSIWMLCAVALKCGIEKSEVKRDAEELLKIFNDEKDHKEEFSSSDLDDALSTYGKKEMMKYKSDYICDWAGVERYEHARRNGRTRKKHFEYVNLMRELDGLIEWNKTGGRPDKKIVVEEWQKKNPNGTKYQCQKETKLSKHTIRKWWRPCGDDNNT